MKTFLACLFFAVLGMRLFAELLVRWVPEGYEDETGFHYGRPPRKPEPVADDEPDELHLHGVGSDARPDIHFHQGA